MMLSTITKVVILLSAIFHICESCGGSFSSLNGQLTSPNYPSNYDNNLNCSWEITTPVGYLHLNFVDFITESCDIDQLEIRDGHTGDIIIWLCGDEGSYVLPTSTNFVRLVFITDRSKVYRGWNMTWSTSESPTALDFNYAFGKAATQSSTYSSNSPASNAVDGDLRSISLTLSNEPGTYWWKVDLGDRILLEKVDVYVYGSLSFLGDVCFLTNPHNTLMDPNTNQSNGWNICSDGMQALNNHLTRKCATGIQNPVTRLFSIVTDNSTALLLREVLVFGYELPELSEDIALAAEEVTNSSITITFSQWNQPMSRALPPTQYIVTVSGGESKTVAHNSNSGRLSTAFNGLNAGQTYIFTVSCTIQGIDCTGPNHTGLAATLCADPSPPSYSMNSSSDRNGSTMINIRLQESNAHCEYITEYTIRVRQPDGSVVHNQTTATGGDYIINNLYGFTNYTVAIEAVNNEGLRSESRQPIITVETVPLDGPGLELSFTEDCVQLYLQPPQIPNGKIINYQYWCAEVGTQVKGSISVFSEEIKSGIIPSVCELPLATKMECDALAVNSVGESPRSTVSGYTNAAVVSSDISHLMSPAVTNSELVVISIYPVEVEDSTLQVRSYLVLLRNGTSTEEKCDIGRENCIIIADIDSGNVTADGYWFHIGDGKLYGGYVNSALVPKSTYSVQIAVLVQLPENGDTFYQTLSMVNSFSAPSSHCDPPPAVDNAIAGSSYNEAIGEKVLYTCEDGYQRVNGDYQLVCVLTDIYESVWDGNQVVCRKEQNWIIGVSVGGGVLVLLVGIAISIAFIKKRKQPEAETSNNPVPTPMASNCGACNIAVGVQSSKADDECVYEDVAMDTRDGNEYETASAAPLTSEHIYDTC